MKSTAELQRLASEYRKQSLLLREGHALFNVLWDYDNDEAERILGTQVDPFYRDERIPEFLASLRRAWGGE